MTTVSLDEIRFIIAEAMGASPDDINADTTHETLELWDSLRHMRLMMALEEEYGIKLTDQDVSRCVTVQAILETVTGKLGAAGA